MTLTVKDANSINVDLETRTGSGGKEQPTHNITTEAGAGQTIGTTGDAAVSTDTTGTLSSKLRGLVKILAAVADVTNGFFKVQIKPFTSGGLTRRFVVSAASDNATRVSVNPVQLYGWHIYNNATYPIYVKIYDAITNPPVPGTTPVFFTIGVPAGGGNNWSSDIGIELGTGLGFSILKDLASSGTTAVALNDCVLTLMYK